MAKIIDLFTRKPKRKSFKDIKPYRDDKIETKDSLTVDEKKKILFLSFLLVMFLGFIIIKYFYIPIARYATNKSNIISSEGNNNNKPVEYIKNNKTETEVNNQNDIILKLKKLNEQVNQRNLASKERQNENNKIYSWKDKNGVIHYTNR